MRCAVLGGGGFIGSNLVRRLIDGGHDVIAIDREFPSFRRVALEGAELRQRDLIHYPYSPFQHAETVDALFHLAADMGGVGYFHSEADLGASLRNGRMTADVAHLAARDGTRVFYASSACTYPIDVQSAGTELTEDLIGHGEPDALYGSEKLHGLRLFSKIPNARVGVLHTVYGPLQEHEGRRMKFPAAVATKAIAARDTGTLELWGDGEQTRTYLHVQDAIDRILAVTFADDYEGPVNIGSDMTVTCRQVAQLCLDLAGASDATITTNTTEPTGVLARNCSNDKYERLYGPASDRGYIAGFADMIDWLDTL